MSHGRSTNSAKDRAGLRVNGVARVVGLSDLSDFRVLFMPILLQDSCQTFINRL
jgi:hypothetical protein